ncbi:MAG TPA: N-6 DNA methylase [Kofleriaceae bacterium]|nr:N-6 DNA methylase [Kofleriaceae bacterium]
MSLELSDEQLRAGGDGHERGMDRAARRASAVFYTPPHLVALAVNATIRTPARVLDPACGAGVFLVEALRAMGGRTARERASLAARLVGLDVDPTAVALAQLALAVAILDGDPDRSIDLRAAVAGIRVGDTLVEDLPTFDVVLGNPPWGQKRFAFTDERKRALRARYAAAAGRTDIAACFVERALELLEPGGRFAFVLPDVVLLKQHEPLRVLLLERATIDHLAHAGRAFRGVGLDSAFLAGRRGAAPPDHRVTIWRSTPRDWAARAPDAHTVPQRLFAQLPGHRFNLALDEDSAAALAALADLPKLADDFEIHEGVHSGNRRAALFRAERPAHGAKLIVGGDELRAFRLRWDGAWIDLSPRAIDRAAGGYANLGRPAWFAAHKLIVRRTGDRIVAARDPDGLYVSNNAFVLVPRSDDVDLFAWLAYLNGTFATSWFRAQVPRVGRAFSEIKIQDLSQLPRPRTWPPALRELARASEADPSRAPVDQIDRALADLALLPRSP